MLWVAKNNPYVSLFSFWSASSWFRKESAQMNVHGKDMFGYVVKKSAALVIVTLMSACTASGPIYQDYVTELPLDTEEGRIYVYRTSVGWFRLLGDDMARVNIDGNNVGGCKYRGFSMFRLPPGSHALTVDNGGFPGKCSIDIDVEAGKDHYYVVQRRAAPMVGTMAGFLISGPILSGGFWGVIAGGHAGFFAGALIPDCGGEFSVEPVSEAMGREQIQALRFCL